jgi:acyl dehydratase
MTATRYFEDVGAGTALPALSVTPTPVQLFRFSAVTWNAHRIHYDAEYARSEGFENVAVHSQLHGAFLARLVTDWMGPLGRLVQFSWQNRGPATVGVRLECTGTVRAAYVRDGVGYAELDLEERTSEGQLCAPGSAVVSLPRRTRQSSEQGATHITSAGG